jgi:putative FmdB family regulatory protein
MPIYEYRCENGHSCVVIQRRPDAPVASCQTCSAPVQRVFHPVAVHFKGSGFYNTDYGTRKRGKELKDSAESGAEKTAAKSSDSSESSTPKRGSGASDSTKKSD